MPIAFISYAHSDRKTAERIAADLEALGISIWRDGIAPGENIADRISNAVRSAKMFIVLVSHESLKSNWFGFELSLAIAAREKDRSRRIVPVILSGGIDDVPFLRSFQSVDLSTETKYDRALKQLYQAAVSTQENEIESQVNDAGPELHQAIEMQRQSLDELRRREEFVAWASRATQIRYVATSAFIATIIGVLGAVVTAYPLLADRFPTAFPPWLGAFVIFFLGLGSGSVASKILRGIRSKRGKNGVGGRANE